MSGQTPMSAWMSEDRGDRGLLSLEESARLIGAYAWVDLRLFELLGAWVAGVPEPRVKLRLDAQSQAHSWRASLWRQRLPALPHLPASAIVAPSSAEEASFFEALASAPHPGAVEALVTVYRVMLPRLVSVHAAHLERARPATDGPVMRTLRLILADELDDWQAGERLLQGLIETPRTAVHAGSHQGRLEAELVEASGLLS